MGNKLCAPLLKKPYRSDENPWNLRKDSHLLRLWAEVFRVCGDGEFMRWERVSEDVVPLNISCIEDTPSTVFHISSYNRQVEKIFDVRITQPGTIICPATECFVHWRDAATRSEWGLNFSNASDAKKFRDCCSFPTQRFARKASSASSLRLSPPKKVKGKGTSASSPNSPLNDAKRTVSSPQEPLAPSCMGDHSARYAPPGIMKGESSSTIPRTRIQFIQDELFGQGNITKPSSNVSVYDNVSSPVLRKPTNQDSRNGVKQKSQPLTQSLIETSFTTKPIAKEAPSHSPRPNSAQCVRFRTGSPPYDNKNNNHRASVPINTKISISKPQPLVPAQFTSFGKNVSESSRRTCDLICMETAFVGTVAKPVDHLSVAAGMSRHTSSSESPEWPSPPEPLTPQTPLTPLCSMAFDSDSLKKMLESLPASPRDTTNQGFHENPCVSGVHGANGNAVRPLIRTKSLNVHDRRVRPPPVERQCCITQPNEPEEFGPQQEQPKHKTKKMCVEYELHLRNKCARDSYPDSGIGGMSNEPAGSVWSGDSLRSSAQQDSANSSGGSAGSRLSDYANVLNEDSDVKQFLSLELSDEEGADSDSSIHTMTSDVSYGKQSGAIRKAGWLVVKNWLIHKKRKIELAAKRSWKRYWVCLKGTMLMFFDCAEQATINEDTVPRHILVIEGGIAQAVPEHPKRDNIFALSSTFGDAYLFQASSQIELENWIMGIHSACASSFARHHGKDNTLKLLKHEIQKLDTTIDMDVKMKKMADLQLTVVTDPKSRQAIVKQIAQWEENLEKSYIEQYRLRCYAASLQGSELPNPKVLLANASKTTKAMLGRVGIFTVTSFHALVCSRNVLALNLYGKHSKGGMMSPKSEIAPKLKTKTPTRPLSPSQERTVCKTSDSSKRLDKSKGSAESLTKPSAEGATVESLFRIQLPNNQTILVGVDEKMAVQDLLEMVCNKRQLNPRDHYLRLKVPNERSTYRLPGRKEVMRSLKYETIEVCLKSIIQLELRKTATHPDFGLTVEAELAEDYDKDDELRVYISEVRVGSVAETSCIRVGDEILAIGGKVVFDLDMVYLESLLQDSASLCITIRSCRPHNHSSFIMAHADTYIDHMVCPPPPSQHRLSKKVIDNLIVPGPNQENQQSPKRQPVKDLSPSQIDNLLIGAEQVTAICRDSASVPFPRSHDTPLKPLSEAQKLRKVIMELIETEQAYVKDLNCLIDRYLEPLKEETFLNPEEIEHLFGNIQEIVMFQRMFLQSLEEGIVLEGDFFSMESTHDFRRVLFSLGGSFLYYANHFKVYSSFCASHSRSQKILNPGTDVNVGLREFLKARNPKQQHSATLESYLIKPIQRILKYPLLLQQLCNLTDADTDEHYHLSEALKGMEAVAEHINEMQKIYEEYGLIFDCLGHLYREAHPHSKPTDLSVGELQMYGTVEWCNATDCLGKVKKGTEFENAVFVFRSGVVFLCRERARKRKNKGSQSSGKASDTEMMQRYRTLIPVHELQVRGGSMNDTARQHWWELIHARSDTEGRPQRTYQFCNSTLEAKTDFMKIIRQTIRDSVRKLMVPAVKPATKNAYIPYGGKRIENLPANPRSLRRKHGSKGTQELERHSMDLEENLANMEYETLFRTRSKTIGDLNEVALSEGESCAMNPDADVPKSPSSSNSNLSGSSQSGSAKLMHASASPLNYSSNSINSGGSPIWKPRPDATMPFPQLPTSHPPGTSEQMTASMNTASVYGDCSDIVYRKETKTVVFALPETTSDHKGTEC